MQAYEDAIVRTSTKHAPWHIVPADKKWFRNLAIAEATVDALEAHRDEWNESLRALARPSSPSSAPCGRRARAPRRRRRTVMERGIEFTTFSVIGRCERTGMLGVAIATSEMAVGSRCIHVAPGVGAVVCQASTNPRLGFLGLNLMRAGYSAPRALEEIAGSDTHVERRQLGCLDVSGHAAGRTGADNRPWAGHRAARNVVAAANAVVGPGVVDDMFDRSRPSPSKPLWERLLAALEAGKRAGGQPDGEQSAGLYVVDREPFAIVDLRVDLHPEPVRELRRFADRYFPLIPYYSLRPFDPNLPGADDWLRERGR